MVEPALEENVQALHPLHPHERVAERELERVAEMELAGDVRRRETVDVALPLGVRLRLVEALLLPGPLPALLDALRGVQRLHQPILRSDVVHPQVFIGIQCCAIMDPK